MESVMSESDIRGLVPPVINSSDILSDDPARQEHVASAQRTGHAPPSVLSHEQLPEPHLVTRGETREREIAHIDWFAFTIKPYGDLEDSPVVWLLGELFTVFGIPEIIARSTGRGWNGYDECIELGENKRYGLIAVGGKKQRGTVHVELNASACAQVRDWQIVQTWGETYQARITRIDLAHDDFAANDINISRARDLYQTGGFTSAGRPSAAKFVDDMGSGKGCTLYVGNRGNGKLLRIYEKGKQLGDPQSPWVRVELELRGQNRAIPLDVLTSPSKYLAGGYPCLAYLSTEQAKIRTISKTLKVSLEAGRKYLRTAGGKWLNVLMQVHGGDACAVVSDLVRPGIPRRLESYGEFVPDVLGGGDAVDSQ
jgi:phage replication initiation protein